MDFDPAAFGLPSGFGAQPKSRPKVDLSSTKRVEEEGANTFASNGEASSSTLKEEEIGPAQEDEDEPEAGPSDLSRGGARAAARQHANKGGNEAQEDDKDENDDNGPEEEDDDDEDTDDSDPTKYFPMSHEVILKDHTKAVTALAVDPPGARIISGGYDYDVKMWDFGGMRGDFRPFKSFEPYENYHVSAVWSALLPVYPFRLNERPSLGVDTSKATS
jgi:hypothetical protein